MARMASWPWVALVVAAVLVHMGKIGVYTCKHIYPHKSTTCTYYNEVHQNEFWQHRHRTSAVCQLQHIAVTAEFPIEQISNYDSQAKKTLNCILYQNIAMQNDVSNMIIAQTEPYHMHDLIFL